MTTDKEFTDVFVQIREGLSNLRDELDGLDDQIAAVRSEIRSTAKAFDELGKTMESKDLARVKAVMIEIRQRIREL